MRARPVCVALRGSGSREPPHRVDHCACGGTWLLGCHGLASRKQIGATGEDHSLLDGAVLKRLLDVAP